MYKKIRRILLFLFTHRFLAVARWELHFLGLRCCNFLTVQHRTIRKDLSERNRPLFLNLGSGPRGCEDPHWVNIDGFSDKSVQYLIDFTRPLPFDSSSFDGVFCEHVLEHFSLDEGVRLATEVCRILRPGGCLRMIVPDAELILRRYFDTPDKMIAWRGAGNETAAEIVNSYFRQRYEHQFMYDWITLDKTLKHAGFELVVRTSFGRSTFCPSLVLDDQKYEWESLYVETRKPDQKAYDDGRVVERLKSRDAPRVTSNS
jgi:predicted SAM-dependent methyltransferase